MFLRINNLLNVLRQISVIGIIALGVTMCIITAGIDLSSGAIVAVVSVGVASLEGTKPWGTQELKYSMLLFSAAARAVWLIAWTSGENGSKEISPL